MLTFPTPTGGLLTHSSKKTSELPLCHWARNQEHNTWDRRGAGSRRLTDVVRATEERVGNHSSTEALRPDCASEPPRKFCVLNMPGSIPHKINQPLEAGHFLKFPRWCWRSVRRGNPGVGCDGCRGATWEHIKEVPTHMRKTWALEKAGWTGAWRMARIGRWKEVFVCGAGSIKAVETNVPQRKFTCAKS